VKEILLLIAGLVVAGCCSTQNELQRLSTSDLQLRRYELMYCLSMARMNWDKQLLQGNAYDDVNADLDSVGSLNALVWTFAGGITQPIFFGGELQAAQDLRTAEQKAAAASYVGHALRAFEDVEDALANDYYLRKREGALADAVSSSADSIKFGREQLEQGQIDMFTILRLTGENLAAKVQYTQIRASRLRERVNLYLALGGDFAGTGAPK